MRKKLFCVLFIFISANASAQADSIFFRAFPITDYMMDVNDSVKIVQVQLPTGPSIQMKQVGVLRGVYRESKSDTTMIGTGRCNLIKGDYYYFTINWKLSGTLPRRNDLLYVRIPRPPAYRRQIIPVASHFIVFRNVYDEDLFDRYAVFNKWEQSDEDALIDSMVRDVRFTGNYFLENNPSMNVKIATGKYQNQMVLNAMVVCAKPDMVDFLDYVIARPRLYAGREWKIAEVFATWLSSGAPTVIRK